MFHESKLIINFLFLELDNIKTMIKNCEQFVFSNLLPGNCEEYNREVIYGQSDKCENFIKFSYV